MGANKRHGVSEAVSDPVIAVENASVTFDMDRGTSRVLDNVSFTFERGEIVGVVGESGSGKSMLASTLLDAVVDPGQLSGEVTFYPEDGDPIDVLSLSKKELNQVRWEHIAFVVQGAQSGFNPTMTIGDHFVETLREHDADVRDGMQRANELLRDLYMEPGNVMDSYPHELSGGMKQRALIALGLILEPDVLVMDEPTAALDLLMQRSIISLLADLREKYDLTMVFITHDLPLVSDLADRLAVMYAFEVIELGPTEELLQRAAHPYTRALLNSVPNVSTPVEEMRAIEGSAPDPVNVPAGCSYHPRCPLATQQCRDENPEFHMIDEDHSHVAACFHWEEAQTEIPMSHVAESTRKSSRGAADD
jgi:oligopeptide/dipeptide ABC transporter ATP-binding protein